MTSGDATRTRRRSFTLVEALVALALAALLSAVAGRVAVLTLRSRRQAERVAERMARGASLVDALRGDMAAPMVDLPGHPTPIALTGSRAELRLDTLAAVPRSGALHVAYRPSVVRYARVPAGDGTFRLERSTVDQTDALRRRHRITVELGIASLSWQVWDGARWWSDYPPARPTAAAIRLLRVRIEFSDGTPWARLMAVEAAR